MRKVHLEHEIKGPVSPGPPLNLAKKFRYPVRVDLLIDKMREGEEEPLESTSVHSKQTAHTVSLKGGTWEYIQQILIGVTLLLMYVGFVMNLPMGWTTMAAAIALVILERSANGVYDIDWQVRWWLSNIRSRQRATC